MEDSGSSPSGVTGEPVDTSGLSFTATYDDGTTGSVVPSSYTPTSFGDTAGTQTVTFSFEGTDITVDVDYDVEAATPVLTSLTYTGSLTNDQFVGSAPDLTGLTFTAHYSDSTLDQEVTPTSVLPSTYAQAGSATVTATYTDEYGTASVEISVTVVAVALDGLSISGDWTNFNQYVNRPVDTTGLTILAHYNDGTTSSLADAGLTFYGVKQRFNLQNEYERSTWVTTVAADGEVTLVAKDTNDVSYYGTIANTEVSTPLRVFYYTGSDRPVEANATFYVGDEETHIVECDNVWLYDGTLEAKDKDFFIDLSQGTPITVAEGDIFWYVMDATDYEDPTKSLADAAQNVMTVVGESGYNPEVIPNGTIPGPSGTGYRKTDLEWTIPLTGEGTLQADKDYVFVLAEAPEGTTAGTSVATFAPSDLNEWSVLYATLKPGHAPTP